MITKSQLEKLDEVSLANVIETCNDLIAAKKAESEKYAELNLKNTIEKLRPEVSKFQRYVTYSFEYSLPIKFKLKVGLVNESMCESFVDEFEAKLLDGNYDRKTKSIFQDIIEDYSVDVCNDVFDILPPDQKKDLKKREAAACKLCEKLHNNDLDFTDFDD